MPSNHLLIFDIDGTITHTTEIDDATMQSSLEHFGCNVSSFDWGNFKHPTDEGILRQLIREQPELGLKKADLKQHFLDLLDAASKSNPEAFACIPGVEDLLKQLTSLGYLIAIATGSWEASGRIKLARTDLLDSGIPYAHCDDHFARTHIAKTVEQRAARHYQKTWNRITYFGDGLWDLDTAKKNGYHFIGIDHCGLGTFINKGDFKTYKDWVGSADSIRTLLEDYEVL